MCQKLKMVKIHNHYHGQGIQYKQHNKKEKLLQET